MRLLVLLMVAGVTLAGCSGSGGKAAAGDGTFALSLADNLDRGTLALKGAYLRAAAGWSQALADGASFEFTGAGGNVTRTGAVPAGDYDRLRLTFADVTVGGRPAQPTQSGIELAVNLTVPEGGETSVALVVAWPDAVYESTQGLAFTPVLSRLIVTVDGQETQRLEAGEIGGGTKLPVARMRVFDATGLEAFASTFVAESPKDPVIGNAGNITFTASPSTAVQEGATLRSYSWDIDGMTLTGNTVTWGSPVNGGNVTVRLTVEDSEGATDSQVVRLALKPGFASRTVSFSDTASGVGGTNGVVEHVFDVDTESFENASARLTHVRLTLTPGSAAVPVSDLDVTIDDSAGKRIGSQTGTGSQHTIDTDVEDVASGAWKVRVVPDPAVDASYTVTVTLTWQGVNPQIEAFLASYDDGHTHTH